MRHLAIPVADQERARRFYEAYLGFGARPGRHYEDGVLMLYDASGFALGLGVETLHYGTRCATPEEVRELRGRLDADGVPIVETYEEPAYVSVKFSDPDGHVVEVFWEPG